MTVRRTRMLGSHGGDDFYSRKRFLDLLFDAVRFAELADDEQKASPDGPTEKEEMLARAAVIHACLMLECAANCCLDAMRVSKRLEEEVERLNPIAKFELYVAIMVAGKRFDRGSRPVQEAAELQDIRNDYVHPKVVTMQMQDIAPDAKEVDFGATHHLKIPNDQEEWDYSVAIRALKAACGFVDYFFLELCRYDQNTTLEILISSRRAEFPTKGGYSVVLEPFRRARAEWKIPMRFLGE